MSWLIPATPMASKSMNSRTKKISTAAIHLACILLAPAQSFLLQPVVSTAAELVPFHSSPPARQVEGSRWLRFSLV